MIGKINIVYNDICLFEVNAIRVKPMTKNNWLALILPMTLNIKIQMLKAIKTIIWGIDGGKCSLIKFWLSPCIVFIR